MKDELRFVFDTNVLVSAALFKASVPRQALDLARKVGKVIMSWPTMAELQQVLGRARFDKYIAEDDRLLFLEVLTRDVLPVEIIETVIDCRDPKDNKFLEVAVNGDADCIVSGDGDLLVLNPFRGIPIVKPQPFLSRTWPQT
jgi:putative PIN family toxin of toxin-antitoxin system